MKSYAPESTHADIREIVSKCLKSHSLVHLQTHARREHALKSKDPIPISGTSHALQLQEGLFIALASGFQSSCISLPTWAMGAGLILIFAS